MTGDEPLFLRTDLATGATDVSRDALWRPPAKVAGRYVASSMPRAGSMPTRWSISHRAMRRRPAELDARGRSGHAAHEARPGTAPTRAPAACTIQLAALQIHGAATSGSSTRPVWA